MEPDLPPGASFAYDVGQKTLDEQFARIEALDSKAGVLIAADGVLAGILLTSQSGVRSLPRAIAVLALSSLFVSLIFALGAFSIRRYERAPAAAASCA